MGRLKPQDVCFAVCSLSAHCALQKHGRVLPPSLFGDCRTPNGRAPSAALAAKYSLNKLHLALHGLELSLHDECTPTALDSRDAMAEDTEPPSLCRTTIPSLQRQRNDSLLPLADGLKRTVLEKDKGQPQLPLRLGHVTIWRWKRLAEEHFAGGLGIFVAIGWRSAEAFVKHFPPAHGPELGPCLAVWISLSAYAHAFKNASKDQLPQR